MVVGSVSWAVSVSGRVCVGLQKYGILPTRKFENPGNVFESLPECSNPVVCVTHHAGRGTIGSSTDHEVGDLGAPELLALSLGQQGKSGLLQQGRGVSSWNQRTPRVR
jgi:hypothetical protein